MPEQYTSEKDKIDLSLYEKTLIANQEVVETIDATTGEPTTDGIADSFRVDIQNYWSYKKKVNLIDSMIFTLVDAPLGLKELPSMEVNDAKEKTYSLHSLSLQEKLSLRKIDSVAYEPTTGQQIETYEIRQTSGIDDDNLDSQWTNWCLANFTGTRTDFVFSVNTPERSEKDFDSAAGLTKNFVKVKPSYNYYKLDYENLISGGDGSAQEDAEVFNEKILPNLYTYMTFIKHNMNKNNAELQEKNTPTDKQLEVFENHLTLNGLMENLDVNSLFFKETELWYNPAVTENKFDLSENTIGNYFSLWTETAANRNRFGGQGDVDLEDAAAPYEKIVFSSSDFKIVDNPNGVASTFPMNVEVEIETEKNNFVMNTLQQTKQSRFLQRYISDKTNETEDTAFVVNNGNKTTTDLFYKTWNMQDFVSKAFNGDLTNETNADDTIFIGDPKEDFDFSAPQNSFFVTLMGLAMRSKLDNFTKTTFRGFESILNGDESYSETLVYEVEKWSSTVDGQLINKLQTFYLPNDDTQTIDFFDTQVKYNKSYVYRIFAHKAVFGTSYTYSIQEANINEEEKTAIFTVTMEPNIQIIRIPYYNVNENLGFLNLGLVGPGGVIVEPEITGGNHMTTVVLDEAPLPPEIEIVPLIKEPNKIIINMKDTIGSMRQKPRPIEEGDIGLYQALLEKQYKEKYDITKEQLAQIDVLAEKIFFKSDEPSLYMQMFHTIEKPKTYSDFQNSIKQLLNGPNNSAKITLNFNQKNYFTFRAIDQHGKFSNPTDVYEVEIKEENGMSFPVIRVMNLEEETKKTNELEREKNQKFSITGKRFIHIKPAYQQWIMKEKYESLDFASAFDISDFSIGEAEQSVFQKNRKFKIRLTSKKTGRKVDLNVRFVQRQEKIQQ
jgi:hypothetical protein